MHLGTMYASVLSAIDQTKLIDYQFQVDWQTNTILQHGLLCCILLVVDQLLLRLFWNALTD